MLVGLQGLREGGGVEGGVFVGPAECAVAAVEVAAIAIAAAQDLFGEPREEARDEGSPTWVAAGVEVVVSSQNPWRLCYLPADEHWPDVLGKLGLVMKGMTCLQSFTVKLFSGRHANCTKCSNSGELKP